LTLRRAAGIAGLGYVVGVSIENMEILAAPTLSSSAADIRETYADHAFAVVTSLAGALALASYAAFAALLFVWLRRDDRGDEVWPLVMLVGGIAGPVLAAVGVSANAILIGASALSDDVTVALHDLYLLCRIVSGIFVALFFGGLGVATLRRRMLPRPLPELALAIAPPMMLAPIAAFEQERALETAVTIAFAVQTLWISLAAMWMTVANGLTVLAFVRRCAFLVLVIAAGLIGLALVAVPAATGKFFAWGLGPQPLAAFAGGVYVGSAATYALALRRSARDVRGLVIGAAVLSVSVFVITLTHTDQFDFDRLQAIMWVFLFGAFSLTTLGLLFLESVQERGRAEPLPAWSRAVLASIAVAGGALALALWIDPTGLAGPSPFELPPLGGRFAGSWIALLAVVCGWAAWRNRSDEASIAALLPIGLPAGALIAGVRTIDQLEPAGAAAAYLLVSVLFVFAGIAVSWTARRSVAQ
jgi:hypothetical protein